MHRTPSYEAAPPLVLLLLPCALEAFAHRDRAEQLLAAPGALAVEPARVSYGALGALPGWLAAAVARRQAKRMKLPGVPAVLALFDRLQLPLAAALVQRHPEAEVWHLGGPGELAAMADWSLDLAAAPDLRPAWERMEALGVASGRLGAERRIV